MNVPPSTKTIQYGQRGTLSTRAKWLAAALVLLIGLSILPGWATEYLWFDALGYVSVFWMIRLLKVGLFLLTFVTVLAYLWVNFRILSQHVKLGLGQGQWFTPRTGGPPGAAGDEAEPGKRPRAKTLWLLMVAAVAIAGIFGLVLQGEWDTVLRFYWAQPHGDVDPIYGRDIGFYLFELPLFELLQNTLLVATFIATGLIVAAYLDSGVVGFVWPGRITAPPVIRSHVFANLALFLFALAWGFYLDRFGLLQSESGAVYGAGFTDFHVVRPVLGLLVAATVVLALMVSLFPAFLAKGNRALIALASYLTLNLVALGIAPWAVQSFRVKPNELELETPFLKNNIAWTRAAYGIDSVDERSYGALRGVSLAALSRNQQTIDNIRFWDWQPIKETYRQLQRIRVYYEIGDVDVDRYRIDDRYRQVMVAARELSWGLPGKANTWVNRYLQYTHGYGLVMSLTAEKDAQGYPVLVVKDLPPGGKGALSVSEPAIYYGEKRGDYRIVATSIKEFNYPTGDENVYTSYRGRGGVALDSFWKRLLFAWKESDVSILISSYITPRSRIQFWRTVEERVSRLAPFLELDEEAYLVISQGRLYWIQDLYTLSDWFPYSEPDPHGFNYIRNSVKAVVDAYDGDVTFYVIDPNDPILRTYRAALPALFRPLEAMPDDLRRHLRYPIDLFEAQAAKYNAYHMTVPQVFYNREDLWTSPREKYGGEVIRMKPYYILMKLPEERELQFLLMTPLTPANRDNMIAWLGARSDFPGYGELIAYKLPKERLTLGPIQVEATIDQDTLISQQLSLWDQHGSRVIRGSLLVIPIDQSFIYVEPVYLIAENADIPQLKRIIVSDGERLAMESTLSEALHSVLGEAEKRVSAEPAFAESVRSTQASDALAEAETALRDGNWDAFGRAMQRLKKLLGE